MKKSKKKLWLSVLIVAVICVLIATFFGFKYYKYLYSTNFISEKEEYYLKIPTGSNFDDVCDLLQKTGYIVDIESFKWVSEKKHYSEKIKPGRYRLSRGMNNNNLVNLLRSGKQTPVKLSFISVRTLAQLAGKIGGVIEADSVELIKIFNDDNIIQNYGFTKQTFISMFIPDTYEFYWNTSAEQFVERMKNEYDKFWTEERVHKASNIGLNRVEVSTLASIVEQETQMNDEKARIAGVYINRLKKGIKLQADPTVIFAIGDFEIRRVLFKHLEYDSPYNTYIYEGLPPGPICIPSKSSIEAVLNYENHDYLYFCAKEDFSGYHNFAKTLNQHNVNARKFQNALNNRKM